MTSRLRVCFSILLTLAMSGVLYANPLINEILANPDGSDSDHEFVELRNPEGRAAAAGLWLLQIDGNGNTNTVGTVDEAWDLSPLSFGINGLLVLGNNYDDPPVGGPWSGVVARRTGFGDPEGFGSGDLNNSSYTWLLVRDFTGSRDDDLDTDDDGTLDVTPWSELIDGVGWSDGDAGDYVYCPAALTQAGGGTPDGASRLPGDTTPLSAAAWYNGNVVTNASDPAGLTYDPVDRSANLPPGARLTPGNLNYDLHQPPVIDTDPPAEDVWGLVGVPVALTVSAREVNGDTVTLSAADLPAGATFAPLSGTAPLVGTLNWTPSVAQQGAYTVTFRTGDADGHQALNVVLHVAEADRYLLNEIFSNPNGGDDEREYIELRHTTGAATADGLWVLQLDGNGGTNTLGTVDEAWELQGLAFGNNGLLLLGNNYDDPPLGGPWSNVISTATALGDPTRFGGDDIGNNSLTWLLVRDFTGAPDDDLDTNDDGVLDVTPWTQLLDGVGWTDGDAEDHVYSAAALTQSSGTPDGATRMIGNTSPNSAAAWFNGDILDSNDDMELTYDPAEASAALPAGARLSPGRVNFPADRDVDGDGLPDAWELAYFRSEQAGAAADDTDGDGFVNAREYIADTLPNDPLSYFRDIDTLPNGIEWTIAFDNSSTSRVYVIQWRADLTQGTWGDLGARIPGNGGTLYLTATNAATSAYYRKSVSLP